MKIFTPEDFGRMCVDAREGPRDIVITSTQAAKLANAMAALADDRVMSTAMALKMEVAVLQRELSRALATLELIEGADRARGYPSGREWTEVIKTIRETIAVIKTSECLR